MKDFKKYFVIPASPEDVFHALTIPMTLQLWTGEPAEMSTEPGSEFSLWNGSIVGKILAIEEGKQIVQEWYFGEQPAASIVTMTLHPHKQGTSVELVHTNIPDEDFEDIIDGWEQTYFGALREFYS
jgi:uncharacterized protein YndB with AHSA1/START domain